VTSKSDKMGLKYKPMVFTEQGVAMLSSILNSERAILVNIQIMRAFTQLRQMLLTHKDLKRKIESMERKYDKQFKIVFEAIKQLLETDDKPKKKTGFTVKEKQKGYAKSKRPRAADDFFLTPQARRVWGTVSGDLQLKILNNVWCVGCRKTTGIGNVGGKIERGMLVLRGVCTRCGGEAARVIEKE